MSLTELKQNILAGDYSDDLGRKYAEVDIDTMFTQVEVGTDRAGKTYQTLAALQYDIKEATEIIEDGIEEFEYPDAVANALEILTDRITALAACVEEVSDMYYDIEDLL